MIKLIVITGGYRRDQKTQAPLPFLPLTLEKLQKNVYLNKLTTDRRPPPLESATKAKASFFGKLILVKLLHCSIRVWHMYIKMESPKLGKLCCCFFQGSGNIANMWIRNISLNKYAQ